MELKVGDKVVYKTPYDFCKGVFTVTEIYVNGTYNTHKYPEGTVWIKGYDRKYLAHPDELRKPSKLELALQ